MRFRKKITKGLSVGLGKKKSSVNIGGFNIPISSNKAISQSNENSSSDRLNVFTFVFGGFLLLCVVMAIASQFTSKEAMVKSDSVIVSSIEKPHLGHHKKNVHYKSNTDSIK